MDFRASDVALGEDGSELKLNAPGRIQLVAKVAARLEEKPDPEIKGRPFNQKPFWDIERARIGGTRNVPVEALVNGVPVAKKVIVADGHTEDVSYEIEISRSSWVALRILASSHTNPIFVIVGGKPIREKRSIEWCRAGVDQCWSQKEALIDPKEHADAVAAYDHAREIYDERLKESGSH